MKHETVLTDREIYFIENDGGFWIDGTPLDFARAIEQAILTKLADKAQPLPCGCGGWQYCTTCGGTGKTNLYRHPPTPSALLEAAYAAWHEIGADVAGLDWSKFVAAIEAHKKGQA